MVVAHFSSEGTVASVPQKSDPRVVLFTSQDALVRLPIVRDVVVEFVPKRFVEKKFVEVACEEVEFTEVKFCKVVEPLSCRLERVVRPDVTVSVPVRFA